MSLYYKKTKKPQEEQKDKLQFDDPRKPIININIRRTKPLSQITAVDVPRGLDPEDVATDYEDSDYED